MLGAYLTVPVLDIVSRIGFRFVFRDRVFSLDLT